MQALPKNLETLSFKQLTALQNRIDELKTRKHDEAVAKLETVKSEAQTALASKLAKMAQELGVKPQVIVDTPAAQNGHSKRKATTKQKVPVKFINPSNKDETWTGRGRAPRWLAAKIKGGAKLEDYRINA